MSETRFGKKICPYDRRRKWDYWEYGAHQMFRQVISEKFLFSTCLPMKISGAVPLPLCWPNFILVQICDRKKSRAQSVRTIEFNHPFYFLRPIESNRIGLKMEKGLMYQPWFLFSVRHYVPTVWFFCTLYIQICIHLRIYSIPPTPFIVYTLHSMRRKGKMRILNFILFLN